MNLTGTLALSAITVAACVDQPDEATPPDIEGAEALDGKGDGVETRTAYLAMFSPGILKTLRTKRLAKGVSSVNVGFRAGVGCHLQREDNWAFKEMLIPQGTTYAIYAETMNLMRYSNGQLGFAMRLYDYPENRERVLLRLYCWGTTFEMPTPEAARDALALGSDDLLMELTTSTPQPPPAPE